MTPLRHRLIPSRRSLPLTLTFKSCIRTRGMREARDSADFIIRRVTSTYSYICGHGDQHCPSLDPEAGLIHIGCWPDHRQLHHMMAVGATTFGAQQLRVMEEISERPKSLWACDRNSCKTATIDRHTGYPDWCRDAYGMARHLILDGTQYLEKLSHAT